MPAVRTANRITAAATKKISARPVSRRVLKKPTTGPENITPFREVNGPECAVDLAACQSRRVMDLLGDRSPPVFDRIGGIYFPLKNTLERETFVVSKTGKVLSVSIIYIPLWRLT